ncbi:hypothetical protein KY285_000808 [Solanum tuberosum]|nr:hypothetical protein KY285_000808 [Solanum tuberosum]
MEVVRVAKNTLEKGPGTNRKQNEKEDTKLDIVNNLHVQKVLGGRVFDPTIIKKSGMNSLADLVEIQSWTHLFMTKSPIMHEDQVREFYYNVEFNEDGSLHTMVGDKRVHLNEKMLWEILEVPREGIIFVIRKLCTKHFANECSKLSDMHRTLVECECIEGQTGQLSKMSQLVAERDQLKLEPKEMTALVGKKDAEMTLFKAQLTKAQTEGPGTEEVKELRLKNAALLSQTDDLQERLIKTHEYANDRLTFVIKSLTHQPPSS